jgi:hypothetical protein
LPLSRRSLLSIGARAAGPVCTYGLLPPGGLSKLPDGRLLRAAQQSNPAAWMEPWRRNIHAALKMRYCDTAMGEEIGWLIAPVLESLYCAYIATNDATWLAYQIDWAQAWIQRGVREPDGYIGWPKTGAAGTVIDDLNGFYADSLLGEAMALRPIVLMASTILNDPALAGRFGAAAQSHLELACHIHQKWERRAAWRTTAGNGMISIVLPYGIDQATGRWTPGERDSRNLGIGFSHPGNKANLVALWLLAMADATGNSKYREQAEFWFKEMKSRMHLQPDGTYRIWNYWEPAGPWDYTTLDIPKQWIGVHPNPGYYEIDVKAVVAAYQHDLVYTDLDIERLIRTAVATGRMWAALAPLDCAVRSHLEHTINPESWDGMTLVPWLLGQGSGHCTD